MPHIVLERGNASRVNLPRYSSRGDPTHRTLRGLAFTWVTACILALSPRRDTPDRRLQLFRYSLVAAVATDCRICQVGLTPPEKRGRFAAHAKIGNSITMNWSP